MTVPMRKYRPAIGIATAGCACVALALALTACDNGGPDTADTPERSRAEPERPYAPPRRVSLEQAADMIRSRPDVIVLDCRPQSAYDEEHLNGAVHLNPFVRTEELDAALGELDSDATYLLYCIKGKRSAEIADRMAGMGFEHVFIIADGGYEELVKALRPEE